MNKEWAKHLAGCPCDARKLHEAQRASDERDGRAAIIELAGAWSYRYEKVRRPPTVEELMGSPIYYAPEKARARVDELTREWELAREYRRHITVPKPIVRADVFEVTCPSCLAFVMRWTARKVQVSA